MATRPTEVPPRYAESGKQIDRARRSLAGGVATAMRASQRPVPLVIDHGDGSHLFDIDGNEYVDYVIGFGPMLLGHTPEPVTKAVSEQIGRGFTFGAQHRLEAEAAERVTEIVPCADLVCFSTTGSEAVHAALRIARATTGRPKILRFEGHYHGWIDPMLASAPGTPPAAPDVPSPLAPVPGTPGQGDLSGVLVARWNDAAELERVLAEHGDDIAAVIMEPIAGNGGLIAPASGYLEAARELTRSCGSMLIFDEVVTGFRVALGGAQERYGVTPDLATYGKAIAAGMPLSAVAGTAEAMEMVADGRLAHVGTFNCAPPAAAATVAALDAYRELSPGMYEGMESIAEQLAAGLAAAASEAGVAAKMHQVGPLLQMFMVDPATEIRSYADTAAADPAALARFSELMLARGVIVLPRGWWFISAAHTNEDVEATLEAARGAFAEMAAD